MTNLILVSGAAGRVGAVGRTVTELLLKQRWQCSPRPPVAARLNLKLS
jgi:hypothetical protein